MLRSQQALTELATARHIYQAAHPGYTSNFSRDSLTYGLLADDLEALEAQVAFSAELQGSQTNSHTGEEPGKIHHEWPGVTLRGLETTYNACDTTALFLLAIARLARRARPEVLTQYRDHIERALEYIAAHTIDGIFTEDPAICKAERFALKVTYWKDSELHTVKREPTYPISYSLVHFQNKAAVQEMGHLLHRYDLLDRAWYMTYRGLEAFWQDDHFVVAREGNGHVVDTPSSDSLHALLYVEPHEIEDKYPRGIVDYSERLATKAGYLPAIAPIKGVDPYHTSKVWVHEQALLHAAAHRHGLARPETIAERIIPVLERGFPELANPQSLEHAGNPIQLWAIGAHLYFERIKVKLTLEQQGVPTMTTDTEEEL